MRYLNLKMAFCLLVVTVIIKSSSAQEWDVYKKSNSPIPSDEITDIAVGPNGTKWIGTSGSGLIKLSDNRWDTLNTNNSNIPFDYSNCLTISKGGDIWFGTFSVGAYGQIGNRWKNFSSDSLLPADDVKDIAIGKNGAKWFGTKEGLIKLQNGDTTSFNGLGNMKVKGITITRKGNVWLAIGNGVARYDGQSWKTYTSIGSGTFQSAKEIAVDSSGTVWAVGDRIGLARYDANDDDFEVNSTYDDDVTAIAVDGSGDIWIGRSTGEIAHKDGGTWNSTKPANTNLPSGTINAVTIAGGDQKWVGYDSDGIATSPQLGGGSSGLNPSDASARMQVTPNPVDHQLSFRLEQPIQKGAYKVLTMQGQSVKRGYINASGHERLSVRGLSSGVYYLRVTGKRQSITKKFVVQ